MTRYLRLCPAIAFVVLTSDALVNAQSTPLPAASRQTYYDDARGQLQGKPIGPGENLHVILVIDTYAKDAKDLGIAEDGITFLRLLNTLFPDGKSGKHKLASLKLLAGADVTEKEVTTQIKALPSNERDTILFYYSGHGGTDEIVQNALVANAPDNKRRYDFDNGYLLATSRGVIPRTVIKEAMADPKAQHRILITDCCANFPKRRDARAALRDLRSTEQTTDKAAIRKKGELQPFAIKDPEACVTRLFFDSAGWVSINAAPPSQTTPGDKTGGIFTNGMIQQLKSLSSDLYCWQTVGHVPVKRFEKGEPLPNPGGVRNGLEDPQFIYSYVFSDSIPLRELGHK